MKKEVRKGIPFNLQFFAEEGGSEENGNGGSDDASTEGKGSDEESGKEDKAEKTFTQSEVSAMMAREKKQGKNSVLKSLGFTSEKEAKDAFNLLKALTDSQKSAEEKAKEIEGKATKEKQEAETRAMMAEAKLSCVINGVDKDAVDDVLVIAMAKVTDDKTIDDVLTEMKKEKRYASFFNGGTSEDGTGNPPGHSTQGGKSKNWDYGKSLAESNKSTSTKKKSYFD